jgi:hypothetical protein
MTTVICGWALLPVPSMMVALVRMVTCWAEAGAEVAAAVNQRIAVRMRFIPMEFDVQGTEYCANGVSKRRYTQTKEV